MKRFELLDGESVIIQEPIHWKNYIIPVLLSVIGSVLLVVRAANPDYSLFNRIAAMDAVPAELQRLVSLVEGLVIAGLVGMAYYRILATVYIRYYVTDRRIIAISGIIGVKYQEMLLSHCEMVYLKQNVYERLFRTGDVQCISAGAQLLLDDVYDAVAFKQTILRLLMERKQGPKTEW